MRFDTWHSDAWFMVCCRCDCFIRRSRDGTLCVLSIPRHCLHGKTRRLMTQTIPFCTVKLAHVCSLNEISFFQNATHSCSLRTLPVLLPVQVASYSGDHTNAIILLILRTEKVLRRKRSKLNVTTLLRQPSLRRASCWHALLHPWPMLSG